MAWRAALSRSPRNRIASTPRWSSSCDIVTPLLASSEPASGERGDPCQADDLIHSSRQQRQPQALQPGCAVAVTVSIRKAIGILTLQPLPIKASLETLELRFR